MEQILLPMVLLFMRVSAFVTFLPPFGGQHLPAIVKVGIAMGLSVFWMQAPDISIQQYNDLMQQVDATLADPADETSIEGTSAGESKQNGNGNRWFLWTWLAMRELAFGAGLGWVLGLCLVPMRIAGAFLAEEMGLAFATITSPSDSSSGNILAALLEAVGVLLIFSLNLHHGFLLIFNEFVHSYQVGQTKNDINFEWVARMIATLPEHGIAMVAPVGLVMILCLISLLFIMKQTPQFNLLAFGMPYRLLVGLAALILLFPEVLSNMTRFLQIFVTAPEQLVSVNMNGELHNLLTSTVFLLS